MMGTDFYTPLSSALWDYLEVEGNDMVDVERLHDELMSLIVERLEE